MITIKIMIKICYNKIGMVMLFFLANCMLKVDICISPVLVIQTKINSKFLTILYISPGEIFETFVEFDDDSRLGNESYSKYLKLKFLYQYIFAW